MEYKLGENFYKNSSNSNFNTQFISFKQKSGKAIIVNSINENLNDQILLNNSITSQENVYFIKKCKSNSLGPDQIPYAFIHDFGRKTFDLLAILYNKILSEGSWPSTWKSGLVIPIFKPDKDKFRIKGYRSITLLNTMCKLLEKIINHRLNWILEKHAFFSPHQNGFRKNRSTIDNMIEVKEDITQTLNNQQIMGMVNLDIAKAYDSTWRHNILVKLNKIVSKGNFLNLITNFLENRSFRVRANNCLSNEFIQENGVPQGSALSVSLFLIAINDITENCTYPVKFNLYADDFNFWCRTEALAILMAIETILQEAHSNFIILSDSLSTIRSLQNLFNPGDIASKILNNLTIASGLGKNIAIMWIPGHSGIIDNELADKHASTAIKNKETVLINKMSYDDAKKLINERTKYKWQKIWNLQNTKLNEIKRDIHRWTNPNPNRKEDTVFNRLRTGHTRITHGFLIAREEPPICQTCGTLTVKHIIADCLMFNQERAVHKISYNLDSSLGSNPEKNLDLIKFMK
ncbi:hypothetical protein QTP88_014586 [Uroleucon formosanum]